MTAGSVVVIGGTAGLGRELAQHYAKHGRDVVITGRDAARAHAVAAELGAGATGLALDLTRPEEIAAALAGVGAVDHLALVAIDRDHNTIRDYDLEQARKLVTLKVLGYSEVVHTLVDRLGPESSILLFGGLALMRPYAGSTTVSTVNGAVTGMVHTLAVELAPIRVNALHPAIVGDSPFWREKPPEVLEAFRTRTPQGRLVTMADVVGAGVFLLENASVTGVSLHVDGGWLLA